MTTSHSVEYILKYDIYIYISILKRHTQIKASLRVVPVGAPVLLGAQYEVWPMCYFLLYALSSRRHRL